MRFRDIEHEVPTETMPVRMRGAMYFAPVGGVIAETPHDIPLVQIDNRDHFRKYVRRVRRQKPR